MVEYKHGDYVKISNLKFMEIKDEIIKSKVQLNDYFESVDKLMGLKFFKNEMYRIVNRKKYMLAKIRFDI